MPRLRVSDGSWCGEVGSDSGQAVSRLLRFRDSPPRRIRPRHDAATPGAVQVRSGSSTVAPEPLHVESVADKPAGDGAEKPPSESLGLGALVWPVGSE